MPKTKLAGKGKVLDALKTINSAVRDNKLLSRGLSIIPHPVAQLASKAAASGGYGKKRRVRRTVKVPKVIVGNGIFSDIGGGIGGAFAGLGSGVGSVARGLFGGAKRKPRVTLFNRV